MGFSWPVLSTITYIPLIGALVIMLLLRRDNTIRVFANVVVWVDFVVSLFLIPNFIKDRHVIQFVEKVPWIESLGVNYYFGVDGISILLVLLTTFLGMWAVLSSWSAIQERVKEYYIFILLLQTGMLGVFFSLDLFLFYVFWEVMLVPMYFLIGVWGGARKLYAAIKFFLYTLSGSVLMLLAIITLFLYHYRVTGEMSFDIFKLYSLDLPMGVGGLGLQQWLFLAFFVGFAIKVPMFPFHTWLPDAHVEAPTAGSVILAGVLLKMGTYGFVRFSLPMFPEATRFFLPYLVTLSVFGIIYGALTALMQSDMKKLVAYSSVSHLGFVMLGVFSLNWQGIEGGLLQMINHGLSTGGLFLLVGLIYERRHTRLISEFGGLSKQMPIYAILFMIITLSSIGLPTLNGFIGEFTILLGAFLAFWGTDIIFNKTMSYAIVLFATSGIVLGAAYMLWLYQRVMFGKLDNPENMKLKDLNFREIMTLVPIIVICFWIGLYPKTWTSFMDEAVKSTVYVVNPGSMIAEMRQLRGVSPRGPGHGTAPALPMGHPQISPSEMPAGHPTIGGMQSANPHGAAAPEMASPHGAAAPEMANPHGSSMPHMSEAGSETKTDEHSSPSGHDGGGH
jgi:NADH-quinone oxidoreductase subunit M